MSRPRPLPRSLPTIVRELREHIGLTVPELAARLGRGESVVYAWEAPHGFRRVPTPFDLQVMLDLRRASNKLRAEALAALALTCDRRLAA